MCERGRESNKGGKSKKYGSFEVLFEIKEKGLELKKREVLISF